MKRFNIICVIAILLAIIGIVYNLFALETGNFQVYHKIMLVIDSILLGIVIGECITANAIALKECNFERKDEE